MTKPNPIAPAGAFSKCSTSNRGIYQDGWMASAPAAAVEDRGIGKMGDFDSDTWELYHIDEDFSQADNLAAKHPARSSKNCRPPSWWRPKI